MQNLAVTANEKTEQVKRGERLISKAARIPDVEPAAQVDLPGPLVLLAKKTSQRGMGFQLGP